MIAQILKQWLWDCYDHMGRLIVANVVLFAVLFGGLLYMFPYVAAFVVSLTGPQTVMFLFLFLVVLGPIFLTAWFATFGGFAALVSGEKDPGLSQFAASLRRHGVRSWLYFEGLCLVLALLLLNVWFYLRMDYDSTITRTLFYVLAGVCFWLSVAIVCIQVTAIPALFRGDGGIRGALRFGLVATLRYPGATIFIALFLAAIWVVGVVPLKLGGVLLFGLAGTSMLMNSFYDVITTFEAKQATAGTTGEANAPRTWKEIAAMESESETDRMNRSRYERTFRDILRPWEM